MCHHRKYRKNTLKSQSDLNRFHFVVTFLIFCKVTILTLVKKIEKLQDYHDILNQKITHLKDVFDENYPTEGTEWELDERIK